jgi:nucleoside-diphosphate-sugar epimerase
MRVVITGAGGLIGRGVAALIAAHGRIGDRPIDELVLADVKSIAGPVNPRVKVTTATCDVCVAAEVNRLINPGTDIVFHFAAIMSGPAERDFAAGWAINLDGTRNVLEACRNLPDPPKLIFTSTAAIYGEGLPDPVPDDVAIHPRNAYGTQKAIAELMIEEYSRRGFIDGRIIRVAHVAVRSDDTHQGAGAFVTAIVRGLLAGQETICPVPPSTWIGIITPATVFASLLHIAALPSDAFVERRVVQLPALTLTVADIIDGVRRVGGDEAANRIKVVPDPSLVKLLRGIPPRYSAQRASALGFPIPPDIDGVIKEFLAGIQNRQNALQ